MEAPSPIFGPIVTIPVFLLGMLAGNVETAPCSGPLKAILPLARPATIPRARAAETERKAISYHSREGVAWVASSPFAMNEFYERSEAGVEGADGNS